MNDPRTNPLVAGKAGAGRKATIDDLYACAAQLNADAAANNCPYGFQVMPNQDGKMSVQKVEHRPPSARLCTPGQAADIMREFGLRHNPLDQAKAA